MPERECPLELTYSLHRGLRDYVWDAGVPLECQQCFNTFATVTSEEFFAVEDIEEYGEEPYGFRCLGLKATTEFRRAAAEDIGLEEGDWDEGPLTSRTLYEFECPKPNARKYAD